MAYQSKKLVIERDVGDIFVREAGPVRGDDAYMFAYLPDDKEAREEAVEYLVAAYNACRARDIPLEALLEGRVKEYEQYSDE